MLDPLPPLRRPRWPAQLQAARWRDRVVGLVERRPAGVPTRLLPVLVGLTPAEARAAATGAAELRAVGELWVTDPTLLSRASDRCLDLLRRYHREQPLELGMPLETLRRSLRAPEPVVEAVLEELARTGRMRRLEGLAALAGFTPRAAGGEGAVDGDRDPAGGGGSHPAERGGAGATDRATGRRGDPATRRRGREGRGGRARPLLRPRRAGPVCRRSARRWDGGDDRPLRAPPAAGDQQKVLDPLAGMGGFARVYGVGRRRPAGAGSRATLDTQTGVPPSCQ